MLPTGDGDLAGASCQCGTHSVDLDHGLADCGWLEPDVMVRLTRFMRGMEDPRSSLEEFGLSGDSYIQTP